MAFIETPTDETASEDAVEIMEADRARLAADATLVTQDVDHPPEAGLSDLEIFDVTLAAAARCFFSKALDALGAVPDAALSVLGSELQDVLAVGRKLPST